MDRRLYSVEQYPNGYGSLVHGLLTIGRASRGAYDDALSVLREALKMLRALLPESVAQRGHPLLASTLDYLLQIQQLCGEFLPGLLAATK